MDKIFKFLKKRNKKERIHLMAAADLIVGNDLNNTDIKKLIGYENLYRIRIGKFRIIFKKSKKRNIVIKIDEKDDQTYKF